MVLPKCIAFSYFLSLFIKEIRKWVIKSSWFPFEKGGVECSFPSVSFNSFCPSFKKGEVVKI